MKKLLQALALGTALVGCSEPERASEETHKKVEDVLRDQPDSDLESDQKQGNGDTELQIKDSQPVLLDENQMETVYQLTEVDLPYKETIESIDYLLRYCSLRISSANPESQDSIKKRYAEIFTRRLNHIPFMIDNRDLMMPHFFQTKEGVESIDRKFIERGEISKRDIEIILLAGVTFGVDVGEVVSTMRSFAMAREGK